MRPLRSPARALAPLRGRRPGVLWHRAALAGTVGGRGAHTSFCLAQDAGDSLAEVTLEALRRALASRSTRGPSRSASRRARSRAPRRAIAGRLTSRRSTSGPRSFVGRNLHGHLRELCRSAMVELRMVSEASFSFGITSRALSGVG